MIPSRFRFHTFSFLTSLLMSGAISLVMLSLETTSLFEAIVGWPKAWAISMAVAFPTSMVVAPISQRLVSKIVLLN